ncbi:GGDEF domain-containing protein [Actinoplanes sp. NEAU-A12]|uniref:GGDEF domain-containing protein n=1 Tax=Actinoplanes sandaracinus TaxID=3045177 RepID=A0ABT6WX69_9ACTN|nr:GGDEF domain-containing protein [Actinoplanes sandaracinus]MDI6104343.1 GGDEF domain-containing protein [Actinoplanes sandaracinus]
MRWPHATAPAWPVHAGFAGVLALFGIAYAMAGPGARTVIFAVASVLPILTCTAAMWAGHLTDRRPWITATAGLILLAVSMAYWPTWITEHHLGRAEGQPVDFIIATGHGLLLAGTAWALRRHGKNDSGGMLDAALLGLCAAAPVWAWLFAPHLTADATLLGEMLALTDLMVLCGVMGCLVRIGVRAKKSRGPIAYLLLSTTMTLAGEVVAVLTVHGTATWTSELMMGAYLAIGVAVLLPAAPQITFPSGRIKAATGEPPLGWIGAALCTNPLMAAVQAIRGDEGASILLPVGSMLIVPLVLLRLKLLSTQRREAQRELAYHAHHDELTGLFNRRHITAHIDEALAELRAGDLAQVSVLLCDLDGFKPINDQHGHHAGDTVLKTIAGRLADAVKGADVAGRIGGDEFLILIRGELGDGAIERITELVREPIRIDGATVRVGVSIGVATAGRGENLDRDAFINLADTGMYAAKATRAEIRTPRPIKTGQKRRATAVTTLPQAAASTPMAGSVKLTARSEYRSVS